MKISELAYELYKENWLNRLSLKEKENAIKDYYNDLKDGMEYNSFKEYINENGYNGNLYVCFDEFLENEYYDIPFMCALFDDSELYEEYLLDTAYIRLIQ